LVDLLFTQVLQNAPITKLSLSTFKCNNNNNNNDSNILSCIGLLNENVGHISFQSNNIQHGIITFDAFVCDRHNVEQWIIPSLYKILGIDPTTESDSTITRNKHIPRITWKVKDRRSAQQQQQQQQSSSSSKYLDTKRYYEALVHPGMMVMQQERNRYHPKDKTVSSSSSSLRVAIISKKTKNIDLSSSSSSSSSSSLSHITDEIWKYNNIDTVVSINVPEVTTGTITKNSFGDAITVRISDGSSVSQFRYDHNSTENNNEESLPFSDWLTSITHLSLLYDIIILDDICSSHKQVTTPMYVVRF
jgi:hypothetical protein